MNTDKARNELKSVAGIDPQTVSELGAQAAAVISTLVVGLHHWDTNALRRVDWSNKHYIEIVTNLPLATWDGDALTRLVFLAHDACLRVDVQPASPQYLRLLFHSRQRQGTLFQRHPTIEDALTQWRKRHPAPTTEAPSTPTVSPDSILFKSVEEAAEILAATADEDGAA